MSTKLPEPDDAAAIRSLQILLVELQRKPIRKCLLADRGSCSSNIIKAHSVQNAYTLGQLEEKGHVYMFKIESPSPFPTLKLVGRNNATVFTGFCGHHDNDLFKEIDLSSAQLYDKDNPRQACLYFLRACAHEYWKKLNVIEGLGKLRRGEVEGFTMPMNAAGFNSYLDLSIKNNKSGSLDQKLQFESLRTQIESDKYHNTLIKNFVVKSTCRFAVSAAFSPEYDFEGNDLYKGLKHPTVHDKWPLFSILVLPMGAETLVQLCANKKYKDLFRKFVASLQTADIEKCQVAISRVAVAHSENIVMSPRLVDKMPKSTQNDLCEFFTETIYRASGNKPVPNLF